MASALVGKHALHKLADHNLLWIDLQGLAHFWHSPFWRATFEILLLSHFPHPVLQFLHHLPMEQRPFRLLESWPRRVEGSFFILGYRSVNVRGQEWPNCQIIGVGLLEFPLLLDLDCLFCHRAGRWEAKVHPQTKGKAFKHGNSRERTRTWETPFNV